MKKTLALVLALVMVIGLVACGGSKTTTQPAATEAPKAEAPAAEESASAEAVPEAAAEIPAAEDKETISESEGGVNE